MSQNKQGELIDIVIFHKELGKDEILQVSIKERLEKFGYDDHELISFMNDIEQKLTKLKMEYEQILEDGRG